MTHRFYEHKDYNSKITLLKFKTKIAMSLAEQAFFFFPDKALTENREMPWNIRKKSWREESLKSVRGYMEILFQRSVSSNFSIIFFLSGIFLKCIFKFSKIRMRSWVAIPSKFYGRLFHELLVWVVNSVGINSSKATYDLTQCPVSLL